MEITTSGVKLIENGIIVYSTRERELERIANSATHYSRKGNIYLDVIDDSILAFHQEMNRNETK